MKDPRHDFALLRQFVRQADEAAFATVVRRHLDLVYATALRKLADIGAAEEVAQDVFAALARKAWQFGPDDSLPAWLYRSTLLESKRRLRGELRRRRRQQTAAELGTTMNTPDEQPALQGLVPVLDDALQALPERGRVALLLRYYERRSFREVGASIGTSEDAARKRVAGALQQLAQFFQRRGFKTSTLAATSAVLEHTTASAPVTMANTILQGALPAAPSGLATLKVVLSRLTGLTKVQGAVLSVALAAVPAGWGWHYYHEAQHQAATAQQALAIDQREREASERELEQLRRESARLATLAQTAEAAWTTQHKAAEQFDAFKRKILGLLATKDYRWPDDSPFVRIPKAAIKQLAPAKAIHSDGRLEDWAAELLALTPQERQHTEQSLADLDHTLAQLAVSHAYPTNYFPQRLNFSDWSAHNFKTVAVPALGAEAESLVNQTLTQLKQSLGDERTQLLIGNAFAGKDSLDCQPWVGACIELASSPQLFTALLSPGPEGLSIGVFRTGRGISGGLTGTVAGKSDLKLWELPEALTSAFFDPWIKQLGLADAQARQTTVYEGAP